MTLADGEGVFDGILKNWFSNLVSCHVLLFCLFNHRWVKITFYLQYQLKIYEINQRLKLSGSAPIQKQPSRGVLRKRCSENMHQIYRRTPMSKYGFHNVAKQLYWNCTSAWVFSCKFASYFQNTFSLEHLWRTASDQQLPVCVLLQHICAGELSKRFNLL